MRQERVFVYLTRKKWLGIILQWLKHGKGAIMGTIKRIFKDDMRNLIKHFFALIIIIGVCFLPALYAWFNIYSNWDPYGNTEGLKLAAVSMDKGYTNENGEYQNVGEGIIEELRENKSVEWHFVKDEKEALAGIKDGTYYAAVVISAA